MHLVVTAAGQVTAAGHGFVLLVGWCLLGCVCAGVGPCGGFAVNPYVYNVSLHTSPRVSAIPFMVFLAPSGADVNTKELWGFALESTILFVLPCFL